MDKFYTALGFLALLGFGILMLFVIIGSAHYWLCTISKILICE
jgi:hypothetical protein